MKARHKILLFSVAAVTASLLYGQCRFKNTRYDPQCDHLPGVCVYARKNPAKTKLQHRGISDGIVLRSLKISHGSESFTLDAEYYDIGQARAPDRLELIRGLESEILDCEYPIQIAISPTNSIIIKGCYDSKIGNSYWTPFMGLMDTFETPSPISLDCKRPENLEIAPHRLCRDLPIVQKSQKTLSTRDLCETERRLTELLDKVEGFDRCRVENARAEIFNILDNAGEDRRSKTLIEEQIFTGKALIDEIQERQDIVDAPESGFWRGWDWVFGGGLLAGLLLTVASFFRRKKKEKPAETDYEKYMKKHGSFTASSISAGLYEDIRKRRAYLSSSSWKGIVRTNGKSKNKGDNTDSATKLKKTIRWSKMENEKERKEQEENFREEMRNFFRRLQKAETVDECNQILKEYRAFKKKMHEEAPKVYDELKEDRKRFFNAWLGHREMLGGPKAPLE